MSAQPLAAQDLLRALMPGDIPAVMEVERAIYPFPWTAGNFTDSLSAGHQGWILERAGAVQAYALTMTVIDEVHLLNFSIAAHRQGQGLGRWLLAWLCEQARGQGARAMFLEVRPSNQRAIDLYRRSRFSQVGLRRRYYPADGDTREDALVLRREFTPPGPVPGLAP